ncbi:MAG TPA: hypothetical protein VG406_25780 [Isosphaeraceae bacterium]|jgi:WD40 repeat protein|nr:hypothetical protein [Isosphaeraceae bacterium]
MRGSARAVATLTTLLGLVGASRADDRAGDPLPEGAILRLGTQRLRHQDAVKFVAFDGAGTTLATLDGGPGLRLWDAVTAAARRSIPAEPADIQAAAQTPDGRTLATGDSAGNLALWRIADGTSIRSFPVHRSPVLRLAIAPDGRLVASADNSRDDPRVVLSEAESGRRLFEIKVRHRIDVLAFGPDGRSLAVCEDGTFRLLAVPSGEELRHVLGPRTRWPCLAFAPDGKALALGGSDGSVTIWDLEAGKLARRLEGGQGNLWALTFSPDGRTLAAGCDVDQVRRWDVETGRELPPIPLARGRATALAFSPDGRTLAAGCVGGLVQLFDAATGRERPMPPGHVGPVAAAFSVDGRMIATAGDRTVRLWDAATGAERRRFDGHSADVLCVAIAPDGRAVASGGRDRTIRVWDVATGREIRRFRDGLVYALAFSPDGRRLASGGEIAEVRLRDLAGRQPMRKLRGHRSSINSLAFSTDGKVLASGGDDATARLWDVGTGETIRSFHALPCPITSVALSADGATLAGAFDGRGSQAIIRRPVVVWDTASGREAVSMAIESDFASALALTADGRRLAVAGPGGAIVLMETASGRVIRRLEGHRGEVRSLAFPADGRRLVSGGSDTTAILWDATGHAPPVPATRLWDDLADTDLERMDAAYWALIDSPLEAVALVGDHIQPAERPDPIRLGRLFNELDSGRFRVRERATSDLKMLGKEAAPHLRRALEARPSPEVRFRVEDLLDRLRGPVRSTEGLRVLRAVGVLERAGTPEAVRLLEAFAAGADGARLSREARAALARLRIVPPKPIAIPAEAPTPGPGLDEEGYIVRWLVLAPIPFADGQTGPEALDAEQVEGAAKLAPKEGQTLRVGGRELTWKAVEAKAAPLNFNDALGHRTDDSVGFAVCYVVSDADRDGVILRSGSDDELKVYLNGKMVLRKPNPRILDPDQDVVEGLRLKKGANILILKVVNEKMDWSACVRFTDRDGNILKGLEARASPP